MKRRRFLLFAALLFWGWQSDCCRRRWVMGLVLESARFIKRAGIWPDTDFRRIWNFCTLLLAPRCGLCFHHQRRRAAA
jgi:hypothetical protein